MDQYGLTQLRVYVAVFLVWLSGALVWFMVTIFRGHQPKFIQGITYYGLAGLFALFVINPDYRIMRYNVDRAVEQGKFDMSYAQGLSLDAVPALPESFRNEDLEFTTFLLKGLESSFERRVENIPLLSMTWSRYRARAHLFDSESD